MCFAMCVLVLVFAELSVPCYRGASGAPLTGFVSPAGTGFRPGREVGKLPPTAGKPLAPGGRTVTTNRTGEGGPRLRVVLPREGYAHVFIRDPGGRASYLLLTFTGMRMTARGSLSSAVERMSAGRVGPVKSMRSSSQRNRESVSASFLALKAMSMSGPA